LFDPIHHFLDAGKKGRLAGVAQGDVVGPAVERIFHFVYHQVQTPLEKNFSLRLENQCPDSRQQQAIRGAKPLMIPELGHLLPLTLSEQVTEIVLEHLKGTEIKKSRATPQLP
jgi:hypothetical protein